MAKQSNPDFLNGVPELLVLQLLARRAMYGYELVRGSNSRAAKCSSLAKGASIRCFIVWKRMATWKVVAKQSAAVVASCIA